MMKKFRCTVCGHIHEGTEAPHSCPLCKAAKDKFVEVTEAKASANMSAAINSSGKILMRNWKDEHRIGVAKGVDPWVIEQLNSNFMAECVEVGMYIAMARQADREGFPEVSEAYRRIALEEADHASRFAELLGDVVHADTAKNLALRIDAEEDATACKFELAAKAKELGYDAIHDTVHEMCKDEARHGGAFSGLLQRYFNK